MRCFVALSVPPGLQADLAALQSGLGVGRLVDEDDLHLTLAFLGEIDGSKAAAVAEGLADLMAPPVPLVVRGVDVAGSRFPNLVWANVEANEALVRLQSRVARGVRAAGVTLERRRFRPHITLARFPKTLSAAQTRGIGDFLALNGAVSLPGAMADRLCLYQSRLRADGARYDPLAEVPLLG